jgi:two-component system, sensor histidine kinase PdtaS
VHEGPAIPRGSARAYGAAAIIVAAAIGLRLATVGLFDGYAFITVFPAVVLSAYVGGLGPGLFAVALGGAAAWYLLVPVAHSLTVKSASDLIGLGLYAAVATFMVWVVSALEAAIARERDAKLCMVAALEEKDGLLRERELLLTEVRHRVGNNLQQITGLLMLHARRLSDPAAKDAFANATERVNLFAEVHQSLYRSGDGKVPLHEMLQKVATHLVTAHRPVGVACRVEVEPEFVWGPERAVPIVMVVHELVCNAIEHGFGEDRMGTISVSLQRTQAGLVRLTVADDGSGLPPGVDAANSDSLGLSIIRAFARQLNASFGLYAGEGGRGTVGELVFDDGGRASKPAADAAPGRKAA